MSSDIQNTHFIFRNTPERWHAYLKLGRFDRPTGTWLLLFPCWWSITLAHGGLLGFDLRTWLLIVLFGFGALLMRAAGCVVNDLWDINLDAQVERTKTRPLASGELTRKQAFKFLLCLLSAALLVLIALQSKLAAILGVASLGLVALYPLMKRVTWWPQAFLGITFNWGALMGYAAVTETIGMTAVLLYIGGILWTLAYDTVYAHQDCADDALVGIKSTALLFGANSKKYVSFFLAGAIVFFIAAKIWTGHAILTPLMSLPLIVHAVWQIKKWRPDSPQSSLDIFKANRIFALLALLMFSL